MTNAIESQLAKTVAEVAEKDEEIASMQHAGEEVEADHLAADTANGDANDDGGGGVLDGAIKTDTRGSDPTAGGAPEAVADSVGTGNEVVADAGDALNGEVSRQHRQSRLLSLDLRHIWVCGRMMELLTNLLPTRILEVMKMMAEPGRYVAGHRRRRDSMIVCAAHGFVWLAQ